MPADARTTLDILTEILEELRCHRKLLVSQGEAVMTMSTSLETSLERVDAIGGEVVSLRRDYDSLAEVVTALVNNGLPHD